MRTRADKTDRISELKLGRQQEALDADGSEANQDKSANDNRLHRAKESAMQRGWCLSGSKGENERVAPNSAAWKNPSAAFSVTFAPPLTIFLLDSAASQPSGQRRPNRAISKVKTWKHT